MTRLRRVRTESGSVYLIDPENKQIRRHGDQTRVKRVTSEWRPYKSIYLSKGSRMIVFWPDDEPRLADYGGAASLPATRSSIVVDVQEVS